MDKILIINDNVLTNKTYSHYLENRGYSVVTSLNGKEGIKKAYSEEPDLILLDVMMPGIDGFETASRIRKNENSRHTPIIFISSVFMDSQSRLKGFDCGGNDYITEPVDLEVLSSKIKSFIKEKQHTDEIEEIRKQLEKSEKKYRLILESMIEGYFELDMEGVITFFNDSLCRITGYSREELLGMNYSKLTSDGRSSVMSAIMKDILEYGNDHGIINYPLIKKDGSVAHLELSVGAILEGGGQTGFHGLARDVTERKKKDQQMLIMSRAVENSLNAVAVSNIKGEIEYANNAFFLMWGLEYKERIPGVNISEFIKSSGEEKEIMKDLLELGTWLGELNVKSSRGIVFNVFMSASIIRDVFDEPVGIATTFVDITMRKKAEQKLRESETNLAVRNNAIEREMKLAQYAQRELIKAKIPDTDLLSIGYRYKPLEKIGGDYFSFSANREGSIGIFLGDVSGHGVASALFISLLKSVSDRVLRKYSGKPSSYISMLNRELTGNMSSYYITGIYGVFEKNGKGDASFTFTNGGHPPPVLVKKNGEVQLIKGKSMVIGIKKTEKFEQKKISLEKGDRLYLYTDGLPETMNEKSEIIGYDEKFSKLFVKSDKESIENQLDAIMSEVDHFRGEAGQHDDMLLIGFEVL